MVKFFSNWFSKGKQSSPSGSSQAVLGEPPEETFFDAEDGNSLEIIEDLDVIPAAIDFKRHVWKNNLKPCVNPRSANGVERKLLKNTQEYIEGRWTGGGHLEKLLSFQFIEQDVTIYVREQTAGYLCTLDEDDFVARVQFKMDSVGSNLSLEIVKRDLLRNMSMNRIISDRKLDDLKSAEKKIVELLKQREDSTAIDINHAEDIYQITMLKQASIESIVGNKFISLDLKNAARDIQQKRKILENRRKTINHVKNDQTVDLKMALEYVCKGIIRKHRDALYGVFPWKVSSTDYDKLESLESNKILHFCKQDLVLFTNLCNLVKDPLLLSFVKDTWNKLFLQINQLMSRNTPTSLRENAPLTNQVSFFLCKSFQEIISEIIRKSNLSIEKILLEESTNNWSISRAKIPWKSASPLNTSLEQQFHTVFKLMLHFSPGYYTRKQPLKYDFKVLKNCNPNVHDNMIWSCILDAAIDGLLLEDKANKNIFDQLLEGYVNFSKISTNHEALRVITHNMAKFIVQTSEYLAEKTISYDDRKVLSHQIDTLNRAVTENNFEPFRDLVEVYNDYWDKRQNIIVKLVSKIPAKKFRQDIMVITQKLVKLLIDAHEKRGTIPNLIDCLRSFNELLTDLNDVDFTWIVKWKKTDYPSTLSVVNKSKQSYKVTNPENYLECVGESVEYCRHYTIEVLHELVDIANKLFLKEWPDNEVLSSSTELLSAIRKSLMYLKEQADYESFENFKAVSVQPFAVTLQKSKSSVDFIRRIGIIGESFWYLRKQDEIDINEALRLYKELNANASIEKLKQCYDRYQEEFQKFLQDTANETSDDRIDKIVSKVKQIAMSSNLVDIIKWDEQIKFEIIPELIAGFATVWSIRESRDLVQFGQYLKPHCIQIVCVFLLLGLDSDQSISKHLAQVLTGQGKSLVLGLLSAVLALTGNNVRMVCYSEYLAKRDRCNFEDFFTMFGVHSRISYGTFEEMANEILNPTINGKKQCLRQLVEKRILNHDGQSIGKIAQLDVSKTILLIDEVDVFFTDQFYGNYYNPCTRIKLTGLTRVQEKIWKIVQDNIQDKDVVFLKVKEFIEENVKCRDTELLEFHKFYYKPGKFWLLSYDMVLTEYTNESLIDEHLKLMISTAANVVKGSDADWYISKYKLNENGVVSYRNPNGLYSIHTISNYYNSFNYFRLKETEFDHKSFQNYGYLLIECGKVSYAKLPENYPIILGVSGTLTSLNDHEKQVLNQEYNIHRTSDMPSFFGRSNLEIRANISYTKFEQDWLDKIYSQTNSQLNSKRSVLIFFDTDCEINKFTLKHSSFLERFNILTENTNKKDKKRFVNDAGIVKTVTLATRQMGRGVDFKSSVAVENAGGVHVIQTFFSIDIKEETQIKGRTARKNNKGSYELVLCAEHLKRDNLIEDEDTDPSYSSLDAVRKQLVDKTGANIEEKIKNSEEKHNTTWSFYQTFFK